MDYSMEEADSDQIPNRPFGGKEATIFVIDCRKSMFCTSSGQTPFNLAITCVRNAIANTAISCSSDEVAVLLLGTEKTQNSYDFKHIFVLELLKQASADLVLLFDKILLKADECEIRREYGLNENYSLGELFWLCNGIFNKEKKKYYGKSVLFFTNEDDPYKNEKSKRNQSVVRASDLASNHVDIHVIPLCSDFDFGKYYNEIVTNTQIDKNYDYKLEHLMKRIRMKSHKQRIFSNVPFILGPGVKFSVSVHILVRETKKPFSIKLDRRTNSLLLTETQLVTDTDEVLEKSEVIKTVEYGQTKISFEKEELKQFKNNEPNLTLLGFKPIQCMEAHYHKAPSYFIIPNETGVKGSNCLFNALIQKCRDRRVMAICKGVFRRTSNVSLIALIPPTDCERLNLGFHAVILPYSEDIRELNLKSASPINVEPQLIDTFKDIIKSLKRDYTPDMIKNPALQKFYTNIEALALHLNEAEPTKDDLKPDLDLIEKVVMEYKDVFEFNLPGSHSNTALKNDVINDLRDATKLNKLGGFTVKQLTDFCKLKGINYGKKKAEIISSIMNYYKSLNN